MLAEMTLIKDPCGTFCDDDESFLQNRSKGRVPRWMSQCSRHFAVPQAPHRIPVNFLVSRLRDSPLMSSRALTLSRKAPEDRGGGQAEALLLASRPQTDLRPSIDDRTKSVPSRV
ncbi:hypothetical protein BDW62DRAFT_169576 [Aspergillus aurantiobrunneus]